MPFRVVLGVVEGVKTASVFGSRSCSDGGELLNMSATAVSTSASFHGRWTTLAASANLLTGGYEHVHILISVPVMVPVFQDEVRRHACSHRMFVFETVIMWIPGMRALQSPTIA